MSLALATKNEQFLATDFQSTRSHSQTAGSPKAMGRFPWSVQRSLIHQLCLVHKRNLLAYSKHSSFSLIVFLCGWCLISFREANTNFWQYQIHNHRFKFKFTVSSESMYRNVSMSSASETGQRKVSRSTIWIHFTEKVVIPCSTWIGRI